LRPLTWRGDSDPIGATDRTSGGDEQPVDAAVRGGGGSGRRQPLPGTAFARLHRERPARRDREARSRLNTALGIGSFIGGAIGSAAATMLWSAGGWPAAMMAGTALCCLALIVWALGRRGPLVVGQSGR